MLTNTPLKYLLDEAASSPLPASRRLLLALPGASTPPRDFYLPQGQRIRTSPARMSTYRIRPIPSRSPPLSSFTIAGDGSPFLGRYVSGGLLFLKPLVIRMRLTIYTSIGKIILMQSRT